MNRTRPTLLAACGLLVLAAGCGSASDAAATGTTTAAATTTVAATTAAATTAADTTTASTTAGPTCGVDLTATAITDAIGELDPPFAANPDVTWASTPDGGTYDPCRTLSAATVAVEGATGSSPEAVLLFHAGSYVGPASPTPYAFTQLDAASSTDDTVAVTYRYPRAGESNADASGTATVRYQWDGSGVTALDALPSAITG